MENVKLSGNCPDPECKQKLYFESGIDTIIECPSCRQTHETKHLLDITSDFNKTEAMFNLLQNVCIKMVSSGENHNMGECVKVKGVSNYECKLVSPLLTRYGLDKQTNQVKLLKEMNKGETFDCSVLASHAFLIDEKDLLIRGYGRDSSSEYLKDTLEQIRKVNNDEERLVPIHADGDGHCLLHAISRALVGRELFWHPLASSLKAHIMSNKESYKKVIGDFYEDSEWDEIIAEADPNFIPRYGEVHGLRNIHIFGLANILHRPIILFDSWEGMESKGDYSAVFLPALISPNECNDSQGVLNKPIAIAWHSRGRNHFVPLVGLQGKQLPVYPETLLPKVWGVNQNLLPNYITFIEGNCIIGGKRSLSEPYLLKLYVAMEKHFKILNNVAPKLVTDVYHYLYLPTGNVGHTTQAITEHTYTMVKEERLFKCLTCHVVHEEPLLCPTSALEPGGELYDIAIQTHSQLTDGKLYQFPSHGDIVTKYSKAKNRLLLVQFDNLLVCKHCKGKVRLLKSDGSIVYFNGDPTKIPASKNSQCKCGYKHYWEGKHYDNLPLHIPVSLTYYDSVINDYVYWFDKEIDETLNSSAYALATEFIHRKFPNEGQKEILVQNLIEQIFKFVTEQKENEFLQLSSIDNPDESQENNQNSDNINIEHAPSLSVSPPSSEIISESKPEKRLSSESNDTPASKQSKPNNSTAVSSARILKTTSSVSAKKPLVENRIRISYSDKGHLMYTLAENTTFDDIQNFVAEKFSVEKSLQTIKFGFPRQTLTSLNIHNIKAGERLSVFKTELPISVMERQKVSNSSESNKKQRFDTENIASVMASILGTHDLWDWASTQPVMFRRAGIFYRQAFADLVSMKHDQHFALPCFPNKVFSYDSGKDEIMLCLGPSHISVRPLTPSELVVAEKQYRENSTFSNSHNGHSSSLSQGN